MAFLDRSDPMFVGVRPTGIVWADRRVARDGDYLRVAFLSFATLELRIERECSDSWAICIRRAALKIQERKGEDYPVSTCGQTVRLGRAL